MSSVTEKCVAGRRFRRLSLPDLLRFVPHPARVFPSCPHEAIIEPSWIRHQPLLWGGFPQATPEKLKNAHSYVYGGS